jgi:hypothetical protein
MTMKPTEKKTTGQPSTQAQAQPQEQMELAYQIHTLAQMLYGHISASHPWATQPWGAPQPTQPGVSPMQPGFTAMQPGMHPVQPGFHAMQPGVHPMQPGFQAMQPGVHPMQPGITPGWVSPQQTMQTPFMQYPFGLFPR